MRVRERSIDSWTSDVHVSVSPRCQVGSLGPEWLGVEGATLDDVISWSSGSVLYPNLSYMDGDLWLDRIKYEYCEDELQAPPSDFLPELTKPDVVRWVEVPGSKDRVPIYSVSALTRWYRSFLFRLQGTKWNIHPCCHLRKRYTSVYPSVRMAIYNPGYWVRWPTSTGLIVLRFRPSIGFKSNSFSFSPPIESGNTSRFMTKEEFKWWSRNGWSLNKLRKLASTAMIPDMEAGLSLPVFLAELKDFPRMIRQFKDIVSDLPNFVRDFLAHPIKEWASLDLSTTFGWLPFVADMKKILIRFYNLRKDVSHYVNDAGKVLTYHFKRSIDPADVKPLEFYEPEPAHAAYEGEFWYANTFVESVEADIQIHRSLKQLVYSATATFHYEIPQQGSLAYLLAAMDRFGINVSPSDWWEVVPFSFVVDWFYDVGRLLERLDFTNLPSKIVIHDFCDSIKFEFIEEYEVKNLEIVPTVPDPQNPWIASPAQPSRKYIEEGYYRWTGNWLVDQELYPNFRTPSGRQIVLLSELVATRM